MNVKHFIVATAAVLVTGSVFAQQVGSYGDTSRTKSARSRAEVTQELKASAANGKFLVGGHEFVEPAANFVSSRTRAQANLDLQSSVADGSYVLAHREYIEPAAGFASSRSRARVIAELRQSREDGSYELVHQEYQGQLAGRRGNAVSRLARRGSALDAD
ncbi:MAG: hypothetical protein ACJ8G3_10660 [Burkholderiaceae bacterium]